MMLNPKQIAGKLNGAFEQFGGKPLDDLDQLPPERLSRLERGMRSYLDRMDDVARNDPALAAMVGAQALASVREMAVLSSCKLDPRAASSQRVLRATYGAAYAAPGAVPDAQTMAIPETASDGRMRTMAIPESAADRGGAAAPFWGAPQPRPVFGPISHDGVNFDPIANNVAPGAVPTIGCTTACGPANCDAALTALDGVNGKMYFEDVMFALMIKIVEDFQKKIEDRLKKLEEQAKANEANAGKKKRKGGFGAVLGIVGAIVGSVIPVVGTQLGYAIGTAIGSAIDQQNAKKDQQDQEKKASSQESRNIEFEKIKFDMQKLSQMQQALSNVLNSMDELAKSAIRQIKA